MSGGPTSLRELDDKTVVALLKQCVADERKATGRLLAVLAEFDVRRLYLPAGFSSLFDYCTRHLHLSERAAGSRIAVARLSRRFPAVLELIADSRVSLTVGSLLARHLNESNYEALLKEAAHKTVSQVEVILARLSPQPDAKAIVRRISTPASAPEPESRPVLVPAPQAEVRSEPTQPVHAVPPHIVKPLSPERYKVQFTISEETREKLAAVQNLLRHTIPKGDLAQIFDRSLSSLLSELERKKLAFVAYPRKTKPRSNGDGSRLIPAAVRRAVWRRDKARCAFVGAEGRCRERSGLELHHVTPFASGGKATVDNIQLRCRAHNSYEAQLAFEGPRAP